MTKLARTIGLAALVGALLTVSTVAVADVDDVLDEIDFGSEGYYRARGTVVTNLAAADPIPQIYPLTGEEYTLPEIRQTSYLTHRLRLMPRVSYGKAVTLKIQIDALDDVLWGDNNGLSVAPLFGSDGSNQSFLGTRQDRNIFRGENPSVSVRRAWLEFSAKIGLMRVGRMPSHWGMGLLANGGGTGNVDPTGPTGENPRKTQDYFFDDDFGDNHFGTTADRVLFATKPIQVVKTIAGASPAEAASNLLVGYAFDKISESPFLHNEPFDRRFRPLGQQGFISRGNNDDINQHVLFALYQDKDWDQVRYTDEISVGAYGVIRHGRETSTEPTDLTNPDNTNCGEFDGDVIQCEDTGTTVWIADLWYRLRYGPWYSEAEAVYIGGKTFGGVPFPFRNRKKKLNITSGVIRAGYMTDDWDAILEGGHAGGDDVLEDDNFKQRAMHADYNVGLVLFEEIIREHSARVYGSSFFTPETPDGAIGFFSNGGVLNANYLHPKGRYRLMNGDLQVIGSLLFAWVDTPATGVALFAEGDGKYLGTEVDLAAKASFYDGHLLFSIESGLLFFGSALETVYPNADTSFTLQSRLAFLW